MVKHPGTRKTGTAAIALLLIAVLGCADAGNRITLFFEEADIRKAAEQYLDAEVRRDIKGAFACLAPSSAYLTTHTYEDYLREAEASAPRITGFKILEIAKLRENHDRNKYPRIDKFVQVEVDVTFSSQNVGETVPVNYSFTFIKEGGRWYKG
jgi:hypothetical protein